MKNTFFFNFYNLMHSFHQSCILIIYRKLLFLGFYILIEYILEFSFYYLIIPKTHFIKIYNEITFSTGIGKV